MNGVIKRIDKTKGFGFIRDPKTGTEYFFHRSAVKNRKFEDCEEGNETTFEDATGSKGPRADDVFVE